MLLLGCCIQHALMVLHPFLLLSLSCGMDFYYIETVHSFFLLVVAENGSVFIFGERAVPKLVSSRIIDSNDLAIVLIGFVNNFSIIYLAE